MTDEVLTNDEMGALLDGVESGEVEVHSAKGPRYAAVQPFEVPARSRIKSNSFPKLALLNEGFAERLKIRSKQMLHCDLELVCADTTGSLFGDIRNDHTETMAVVEFSAAPLEGIGAIVYEAQLVHQFVELFFGGSSSESKGPGPAGFTQGELRVIRTVTEAILQILKETWEPVLQIEPEQQRTKSSIGTTNICDESVNVIKSTFEFTFDDHEGSLHLLLPETLVASVLPTLRGDDREDDPQKDARWAETLRTGATDISVNLSTTVGHASMTLGELICLEPGDIININSPNTATIRAQNVALLEGRFGIHAGHNAVEAAKWLSEDIKQLGKDSTNV